MISFDVEYSRHFSAKMLVEFSNLFPTRYKELWRFRSNDGVKSTKKNQIQFTWSNHNVLRPVKNPRFLASKVCRVVN